MHSTTMDHVVLPSHAPRLNHPDMGAIEQWLLDRLATLLPTLLEMTALVILVLIPWNTAW